MDVLVLLLVDVVVDELAVVDELVLVDVVVLLLVLVEVLVLVDVLLAVTHRHATHSAGVQLPTKLPPAEPGSQVSLHTASRAPLPHSGAQLMDVLVLLLVDVVVDEVELALVLVDVLVVVVVTELVVTPAQWQSTQASGRHAPTKVPPGEPGSQVSLQSASTCPFPHSAAQLVDVVVLVLVDVEVVLVMLRDVEVLREVDVLDELDVLVVELPRVEVVVGTGGPATRTVVRRPIFKVRATKVPTRVDLFFTRISASGAHSSARTVERCEKCTGPLSTNSSISVGSTAGFETGPAGPSAVSESKVNPSRM